MLLAAAGVRDQPLDRAEARFGGLHGSGDLRPVGHVARQGQGLAAGRPDLGCERIQQGFATRDQRQGIASEPPRQAAPDAGRCAGQQGDGQRLTVERSS